MDCAPPETYGCFNNFVRGHINDRNLVSLRMTSQACHDSRFSHLLMTHFPLSPSHVSSRGSLDLLMCGLLFERDCSCLRLFTFIKYYDWFEMVQSFVNEMFEI